MYREGVHRPGEFRGERRVHKTVPLDPALAGEGGGDDGNPEMRLAARPRTGMSGMEMRLVDDKKAVGMKCFGELFFKRRLDRHDAATLSGSACAPLRGRRTECILAR